MNLEQYIAGATPDGYFDGNPNLFGAQPLERGLWSAWLIMEHIAKAVEFIHNAGELYRDLKPRNGAATLRYS